MQSYVYYQKQQITVHFSAFLYIHELPLQIKLSNQSICGYLPNRFYMHDYLNIIGYGAAILTTLSFLPQVIQIIRTKNTDGISLLMYSIFVTGILFWLIYGILLQELPIILANAFTLLFSGAVLVLKVYHEFKK